MNEDNKSRYVSIKLSNFDVRLYTCHGGMTGDDFHNPQKITDSFFPKENQIHLLQWQVGNRW